MMNLRLLLLLTAAVCAVRTFAATSLPLTQDFELSAGGFVSSSATAWKWGTPSAGPGAAHSGTQVWGTNLVSPSYPNDEDATLTSPKYDLSGAAGQWIVVHWWQYLVTEPGFDEALVEVSRDGGGTWEIILGPRSGPVNFSWAQQTVSLDPSYATEFFQIRFRLISDGVSSQGGFFIDDLRLSAAHLTEAVPVLDFESGDGGFAASGLNSTWAHGEPVSAPGWAYSGLNAWVTNLNGLYNANEDSALASPAFDLSGFAGNLLILSWWQYLDTEEDYDFAYVEVSKDNGETWEPISSGPVSGEVSAAGWMRQQAFIAPEYATAGFRFRFRLQSDDTYQFDGFAIDDVAVFATYQLFPSISSFAKSAPRNVPITFQQSDFTSRYSDPDGGILTGITITQLPVNGTLKVGTEAIAAGQTIFPGSFSSLIYEPIADADGTETFTWTARNFFGAAAPATVSLTTLVPNEEVIITAEPESQTVNPGAQVTFNVTAVSSAPLTYQWRKGREPINGATGSSFTITAAAEGDENSYDVVVSNGMDSVTSAAAALNVNDPVTFVQHPQSSIVNEGGSVTLMVSAAGTGRLDYQWYKEEAPIPNATSPELKIVDATESDGATYRCVVTNVVGANSSDPAVISIRLRPQVFLSSLSRGLRAGEKVRLAVKVQGTGPFTYQWLKDGVEIPGATRRTLTLKKGRRTDEGSYSVRISNGEVQTESDAIDLQVFLGNEIVGTYEDVIELQDPTSESLTPFPGRLRVSVGRGGRFSALLEYGAQTYRYKGAFNSTLTETRKIARPGHSPLTVQLRLDPSARSLSVSVTDGDSADAFRSEGYLNLHRYNAKKNPAPQEGRYTVLLEAPTSNTGPEAPGYLTAKVSRGGLIRLQGKMPDGSVFSGGALVQFTSRVAVNESLRSRKFPKTGELSGRLTLPGTTTAKEINGGLAWRKTLQNLTATLPGPFLASLEAVGSRYSAPDEQERVIALPPDKDLLELWIAGPITGSQLQRWIHLTRQNKFGAAPASAERINFSLSRADGRIMGGYTDPTTKKRYRLEGVVLQAQSQAGGMLIDAKAPGAFTLAPLQQ